MNRTTYGQIFFGAAAILFGAIALIWHDAETWQALRSLWRLPFGAIIGALLMVLQICGGLALVLPRSARRASIVLILVYAVFALACIPGIIAKPRIFGEYDAFFEQLSLFCAALAVYAITGRDTSRALWYQHIARLGLAVCAISFTLAQVVYFHETAALVPAWIPPSRAFWAALTTAALHARRSQC